MRNGKLILLLAVALVALACGSAEEDPGPEVLSEYEEVVCYPCDGNGPPFVDRPAGSPEGALLRNVCWSKGSSLAENCWYNCPEPILENYDKGAELCVAPAVEPPTN